MMEADRWPLVALVLPRLCRKSSCGINTVRIFDKESEIRTRADALENSKLVTGP